MDHIVHVGFYRYIRVEARSQVLFKIMSLGLWHCGNQEAAFVQEQLEKASGHIN